MTVWPEIHVVKMSGAGNDFVVLDGEVRRSLGDRFDAWVRGVCVRGISVGADGVLVVEAIGPDRVRVEFRNPDGTEAFCGNGTRCAARYARRRGWLGDAGTCETTAGIVPVEFRGDAVFVRLPAPVDRGVLRLVVPPGTFEGRWIVAGVPHFVLSSGDCDAFPLERVGPALRSHPAFGAEGTNVDVLAPERAGRFRIRTWERGVEGETLSCGSGAVAAALAARLDGAPETVEIIPRSGIPLRVDLPDPVEAVSYARLGGDARVVMEGTVGSETIRAVEP